jgi:hypothetical protein
MHERIRVINISVLIGICAADEDEILLIAYRSVKNASAILEPLPEKALCVVTGCADSDNQLIRVGFHCLFEKVVLFRRLERMNFQLCYRNGFLSVASHGFP